MPGYRTTTTLIGCVNAMGHALRPYFIFKVKRFNQDLFKGCSVARQGGHVRLWVVEQPALSAIPIGTFPPICPALYQPQTANPAYLRWSYLTKSAATNKMGKRDGHHLIRTPSAHAHILQPLDVAVFSPFKKYYYSACSAFMAENIGQIITSYNICQIACKAYLRAMSPANIQSSFLKTAIFRYNPSVISMQQPVPCQGFRVENPVQRVKLLKTGRVAAEAYILIKEENITNKAL